MRDLAYVFLDRANYRRLAIAEVVKKTTPVSLKVHVIFDKPILQEPRQSTPEFKKD